MTIGIGMGLANFPFAGADGFWRWVEMCETGGVDSLWQTDRLVSKEPILECMSAMAAMAGATKRLRFGMNVASVGLRDPLMLAKQCATIDVLSNGRLLPAFGIGSIRSPDWKATGRETKGRGVRTDEGLEIIERLWRGESVTMDGEHFKYSNVRISPLPVQKNFPLWIGGSTAAAIRRTARFGTGWIAAFESPAEAGATVTAIKQATAEQGRQIDEDHYGTGISFRFGKWDEPFVAKAAEAFQARTGRDPKGQMVVGDGRDIRRRIDQFIAAGLSKFVMRPIAQGDTEAIDQTRLLIDEIVSEMQGKDIRPEDVMAAE